MTREPSAADRTAYNRGDTPTMTSRSISPTDDDSTADRDEYTRRELIFGGGALAATRLLSLSTIDSEAVDDTRTVLAQQNPAWWGYTAPDATNLYGDGNPSVHVQYADGKRESILKWVNAESQRQLINESPSGNVATVSSTPTDLGLHTPFEFSGDGGLAGLSYVESIDLNITVPLAEPVTPRIRDDVTFDNLSGLSWFQRRRLDAPSDSGVAFDAEFQQSTLSDARGVQSATASDFGGSLPDTSTLTIAVIDTGVNTDGSGTVFGTDGSGTVRILDASKDFVDSDEPEVGTDGFEAIADPQGHGSWVAGCLAADPDPNTYPNAQGYLPQANVLALRALDESGQGSTANIGRAIRYAADNGADFTCLSLGSPIWSHELDRAIAYAEAKGAITFAAVGNDRQGTRWTSNPASTPRAIGVSAVTVRAASEAQSAYFANVGPHPGTTDNSGTESAGSAPDIAAPGTKIEALTLSTSGTPSLTSLTGTSMATPCAVGCAGLAIATDGSLAGDLEALRTRLTDYARPIPAAGETEVGAGLVDAAAAATEAEPELTQSEARNPKAVARDESYRSLSTAEGRQLSRLF